MTRFDECLRFTLEREGGDSNDQRDPGGLTRFGISKAKHPRVDVANLTREQAVEIYRREYWEAIQGDALPDGLDLMVFEAAVNQGVSAAATAIQMALGVEVDRKIGPATIDAANRADTLETLVMVAAYRAKRYALNPNVGIYGKGWSKRLLECFAEAQRVMTCRT